MFELDKWQEIGNSLWQHKLRTFLTSVGISWGIFMLIFLLGAGKGLENGTMESFGSVNKNTMWVWGGKTSKAYNGLSPGRKISFTKEDFDAVRTQVKGVGYISPRIGIWGGTTVKRKSTVANYTVLGVSDDYRHIKETMVETGRLLNPLDVVEKRKVIFIGKTVADKFFKGEDAISNYLDINGVFFKIIGIFNSNQMGEEAKNEEETIYMPYTTTMQTFSKGNDIGQIMLTLKDGYINSDVEVEVKKTIGARHSVHPEDEDAVGTWGMQEQFDMFNGLFLGINTFIWLVGLGTILIGIISISNIMMIIVKERTKEIGLRKALGASPLSVVGLILHESIVITSVSGFLGLISGVFVVEGLGKMMDSFGMENEYFGNPEVDLTVAIAALLILIFAGTVAGLIPAIQAARINPIEALRTE